MDDAALRGRTTVADRVIEKIARHAAQLTTPVTSGGVLGGGLPAVDVTMAGHRARVTARIAAPWGVPPSRTAGATADRIKADLESLAEVDVDLVEVSVAELVVTHERERRVR